MRVGWSGEVSPNVWVKVDADETDLRRLLVAEGHGDADPARIPTWLAYQLLEIETERFMIGTAAKRYGYDPDTARARLVELNAAKADALYHVKQLLSEPTGETTGDG